MKAITLLYRPIGKEFGINDSLKGFFYDQTHILKTISNGDVRAYLKEKGILKKEIKLIPASKDPELKTLVERIQKINPKAQLNSNIN